MGNQFKYYLRRLMLAYYGFRYSARFYIFYPAILISFGALIFILFIIPQVQNWFSIRDEVLATQTKIKVIKQNIYVLQYMNKFDADNNLILASNALPPDKDFVGILNGINQSAAKSRVALDDFNFSLGNVVLKKNVNTRIQAVIPIVITLKAEGDIDKMSKFITFLEQNLPLIEIKNINFARNKAELSIQYKIVSFPPVALADGEYIKALTAGEINLLNKLKQWKAE
jgi:hypothetical protein